MLASFYTDLTSRAGRFWLSQNALIAKAEVSLQGEDNATGIWVIHCGAAPSHLGPCRLARVDQFPFFAAVHLVLLATTI
jgi:hypothetical protein